MDPQSNINELSLTERSVNFVDLHLSGVSLTFYKRSWTDSNLFWITVHEGSWKKVRTRAVVGSAGESRRAEIRLGDRMEKADGRGDPTRPDGSVNCKVTAWTA